MFLSGKVSQFLVALSLVSICRAAATAKELEAKCKAHPACAVEMSEVEGQILQTKSGIDITKEMVDILGDRKVKQSMTKFALKCTKIVKKVGLFLSVAAPLGELLGSFFPTVEEQLLEQVIETLKREFQIVNQRFNKMFETLTDMTALIKDQHLRTQYRVAKDRIVHSSEVMNLMLNSTKASMLGYKKQVKDVKAKSEVEFSAYRLELGLRDGRFISVFMDAESSNRQRVQDRLMEHYNLISQAVKFYLYWLELKSEDLPTVYSKAFRASEKSRWEAKLIFDLNLIKKFDAQYFTDQWTTRYERDFELQVMKGGSNAQVATRAYQFLSGKYDWRDWLIVVYDPVEFVQNYAMHYCSKRGPKLHHFRWHNLNVFVTHVDPGKKQNQAETNALLGRAVTRRKEESCGYLICQWRWVDINDALKIFNTFPSGLIESGCVYKFVGVIRYSADVQIRTPAGRSTVQTRNGMRLIALS